ncbi:MAG: GTP cyclohydrolase II [Phycisphaerae bacterium]|nr:GTP cyclohydrolase II [Phycisphaerae bacterium]
MSNASPFSPIPEILDELRAGKLIILVDDEDRENEGDLVCAAEKITPEHVNFMLTHGRGTLCLTLTGDQCRRLNLTPQTTHNTTRFHTAFTVTIDAHPRFGVTTGVSAADRAATIRVAVADGTRPEDLIRPGHVNPLEARDGGVLVRAGQTEGSVDLARLAGLLPAGVLIEILNEDGTMARVPQLADFSRRFGIKMCTVASLIEYRLQRESLVQRLEEVDLKTRWGEFHLIAYRTPTERDPQLALTVGGIGARDALGRVPTIDEPVLVRVHSECLTGDVFGSMRCECGEQLHDAMRILQEAGRGVLVYLRQEGRGIGLINKLRAYRLQDTGLDTVEANERLGLPADKRDYGVGAQILRDLGIRRIRVLTNNPKKVSRLEVYGLEVVEQRPIEIEPNDVNRRYLETKRTKLGHTLKRP